MSPHNQTAHTKLCPKPSRGNHTIFVRSPFIIIIIMIIISFHILRLHSYISFSFLSKKLGHGFFFVFFLKKMFFFYRFFSFFSRRFRGGDDPPFPPRVAQLSPPLHPCGAPRSHPPKTQLATPSLQGQKRFRNAFRL